jgi:hypothetical protein
MKIRWRHLLRALPRVKPCDAHRNHRVHRAHARVGERLRGAGRGLKVGAAADSGRGHSFVGGEGVGRAAGRGVYALRRDADAAAQRD